MEKRYYLPAIIFITVFSGLHSQTGGQNVFLFLNQSPSARVSALGGMPIAWRTEDAGVVFQNPSLMTEKLSGAISFAHQFYFADIGAGHVSYTQHWAKPAINWQAGVHYISYGDIPRTDANGNTFGQFKPKETDFFISASKSFQERLIVGANLQYIFSTLDAYTAQGLCMNAGISYFNPDKKFGLSLVFKNAGVQTKKYDNTTEKLPFQIQFGFAKRLAHLPLTYHITIQHLETWNVRYDDPDLANNEVLFGEAPKTSEFEKFVGNFFRHFVVGAELSLSKKENFVIRLGYNHLRKRDLSLSDYQSLSGLSGGFGFKIYKFKFDYSYAVYHLAGGTSQISLSTNINSFLKKDM